MPAYFEYGMKVSLSLAVAFLFYALLLKRLTYYKWNRYFLLLSSIVSFIIPFINIAFFVQAEQRSSVSIVNAIPSIHSIEITGEPTNHGMLIYWQLLYAVFFLVSFILAVRFLIQFLSVERIKSKATLLVTGEESIYHISEPILPFSFLNNIFINTASYNQIELEEIIQHERVHVKEKHSIDTIVAEIVCILNWYNPFAWIIKNAIRENLEFIADDAVVSKGGDKKSYQYLLLKVTGDLPSSIATSLKFSSLKNRIVMMNKAKTSSFHLLKFMLLIPVIALILLAFRNSKETKPNISEAKTHTIESFTLSTLTYSIPDEKVKSIVIKEQEKSLLKPGELLNLGLIHDEKNRLESLLEKNGYTNLKSNAIRFMMDSTTVTNSFSVEVKIDVSAVTRADKKSLVTHNKPIIASDSKRSVSANYETSDIRIAKSLISRMA